MSFDIVQRRIFMPIQNALVSDVTLNGESVEPRLILEPAQFLPLFYLQMEHLYSNIWDGGTQASFKAAKDGLFGVSLGEDNHIPASLRALLFYHSLQSFISNKTLNLDGLIHQWSPVLDAALNLFSHQLSIPVLDILNLPAPVRVPENIFTPAMTGAGM